MIIFKYTKVIPQSGILGMVAETQNMVMKDFCERSNKISKDQNCIHHPNQNSEVTVSFSGDRMKMAMTKYCCLDFKDSVKLEVKN